MRVLVLTGSPKGPQSITLQYARYLEAVLPGWELEIHHVAQGVRALERVPGRLEALMERVAEADLVLWAFPLYYMLVPAPYKRFVELIEERGLTSVFAGKATATLSSSIKYHDHVPHRWLASVVGDWGMGLVGWWSAHMNDLEQPSERARLEAWGVEIARAAAGAPSSPQPLFRPVPGASPPYRPVSSPVRVDLGERRVLVVHDAGPDDRNLQAMVARFAEAIEGDVRVRSLHEVGIRGGCTGCCRCGLDNQCVYDGKDDFTRFYREEVMQADVLVLAGSIRTRQLSATWRNFFDRSFFMGHAPSLAGKHVAWLIAGPLSHLPELREPYETWTQMQHGDLVGWVSDEAERSEVLDDRLDALAATLAARASAGVAQSWDFRASAGRLVFRDAIWGELRPLFEADHRRYRELGYYDFPQRDWRMVLRRMFFRALLAVPFLRKEFSKRLPQGMVAPYQALVARAAGPQGVQSKRGAAA